ncbi:hypothetical protein SAMN05421640_0758 [Ekhidna lutea]|uniref:Uncharacterized protein n=1 Tax=Ekhidna lutea TaxID=447679 RepID=A0A239FNU3_EKHLU|nr:hypothetical protein [Ekhidna lutea]SNS58298.1 hypothetical protein SAMN05421640_0758 [Ekhidna lutea]
MNNDFYLDFLAKWQQIVYILVFVVLAVGVLNYIIYKISFMSKNTYKEKFDLASEKETKKLLTGHIFVAIALFLFCNTLEYETMKLDGIWFFIRLFVSMCIGVLYGYIAQLILKFYYPGILEKKLKKLRYTPRVNPENGNKMKLLSESEEDAYLDEGMQAEENVFSVDYDVWIDEATGYTKIEKYKGHLSALECDRCGFQTLRLEKEEIIKEASDTEDGELLKEFKCSYCNRIKRKNVVLSHKIKDASSGQLIDDPLTHDARISVVRIEIHGSKGEVREYDFQTLDQAKNFLNEFDFEKLQDESI